MGQGDWMPSDENLEHYGLEVPNLDEFNKKLKKS